MCFCELCLFRGVQFHTQKCGRQIIQLQSKFFTSELIYHYSIEVWCLFGNQQPTRVQLRSTMTPNRDAASCELKM